MKNRVRNILYYLGIPIISISFLIFSISFFLCDFEKWVEITFTLIQTVAIFIAWLWAYNKFDWEKRAENALKAKAMIMQYHSYHNNAAAQYRINSKNKKNEKEAYLNYTMTMLSIRNKIVEEVHYLIFLNKKMRERIFNTIWLTVWNEHWNERENLDKNWRNFEEEIEILKSDLDAIVSK